MFQSSTANHRRSLPALFGPAALLLGFAAICLAQPPAAQPDIKAYSQALAHVQANLQAGQRSEALSQLEKTEKSLRGFEFDYLTARANAAAGGAAAPALINKIPKPDVEVRYAVLNELNRQLVFICRDGSLRIYDLNAPKNPPRIEPHDGKSAIWSGAFSHDGKTFCSGHENGDVVVRDAATWKVRHKFNLGNWAVRELAVAPDGSSVVVESQKELELWSLAGQEPKRIAGVGERYNFGEGLAFSPKGDFIATGGMFDILLHDAKTGEKKNSLRHASYTMGLEFSPDGQRIASAPRGNVNKFLAVFDIEKPAPLFNAGPFGNYIAGMAFTPDGKRIAATGCEKVLRIFDAASGEIVLSIPRPECGSKPAFSRDGRLLGWSEPDGYWFIDLGEKAQKE